MTSSPSTLAQRYTSLTDFIESHFQYQLNRDYPLNDFVASLDMSPMNNALVRVSGIKGQTQYIVASRLNQASTPLWSYCSTQVWGRDAIKDAETLATSGPKFNAVLLVDHPLDAVECIEGSKAPVTYTIAVLANNYFDFIKGSNGLPLPERFPPLSQELRRELCAPGSSSRTRAHDDEGRLLPHSPNLRFAYIKRGFGLVTQPQIQAPPVSNKETDGKTD